MQSSSREQAGEYANGKALGRAEHDADRRAESHDDCPAERQEGGLLRSTVSVEWPGGAALPYCHLVPFSPVRGGERDGPLLAQRTVIFWGAVST